jgi:hypothetical protein
MMLYLRKARSVGTLLGTPENNGYASGQSVLKWRLMCPPATKEDMATSLGTKVRIHSNTVYNT